MQIAFAEEGWSQYLYWQSQDKKIIKRINQLLQIIVMSCKGHYED